MAHLVEALYYKPQGRRFYSRLCHYKLSLAQPFRPHCCTAVHSTSNRNVYREYFVGVKAAGVNGWETYIHHVPIVLKSGSLNQLESWCLLRPVYGRKIICWRCKSVLSLCWEGQLMQCVKCVLRWDVWERHRLTDWRTARPATNRRTTVTVLHLVNWIHALNWTRQFTATIKTVHAPHNMFCRFS